jgi:hypothetical protein
MVGHNLDEQDVEIVIEPEPIVELAYKPLNRLKGIMRSSSNVDIRDGSLLRSTSFLIDSVSSASSAVSHTQPAKTSTASTHYSPKTLEEEIKHVQVNNV